MSEDPHPPAPPAQSAAPARPVFFVSLERTAIFPKEKAAALLQAACYYKPAGITGYWTPAPGDLEGVEAGLAKYLEQQGRTKRDDGANYFRQVAGLERDTERWLFLSYFVPESDSRQEKPAEGKNAGGIPDRWKQEPFWMNDGGETYFRVMYDLAKREFGWYERNSDP